jgi:hypothetical protein
VANWILASVAPTAPAQQQTESVRGRKFEGIPIVNDYANPPEHFWSSFPTNELPKEPFTRVNVEVLSAELEKNKNSLLISEYMRGLKCVDYLRNRAPLFQRYKLPACIVPNSKAALKHGAEVTDVIATWVSKKFVSGPFSSPPVKGFRANSILAVPQPNKVRVCLNVSLPTGKSLNDCTDPNGFEKVNMMSAKKFGYSILSAGKNATMLKFYKADAYKNVPAKTADLALQGFMWGGKFFVETRQVFGAKASVQNFDVLGNTVRSLVLADCQILRHLVHRQLDDTPVVAPASSGWCEEFSLKYRKLCSKLHKSRTSQTMSEFRQGFRLLEIRKSFGYLV